MDAPGDGRARKASLIGGALDILGIVRARAPGISDASLERGEVHARFRALGARRPEVAGRLAIVSEVVVDTVHDDGCRIPDATLPLQHGAADGSDGLEDVAIATAQDVGKARARAVPGDEDARLVDARFGLEAVEHGLEVRDVGVERTGLLPTGTHALHVDENTVAAELRLYTLEVDGLCFFGRAAIPVKRKPEAVGTIGIVAIGKGDRVATIAAADGPRGRRGVATTRAGDGIATTVVAARTPAFLPRRVARARIRGIGVGRA